MDRRSWIQMMGMLSSAAAATPQAPQQQQAQQPLRIKKEQVLGALAILGLEYQDAEVDMLLRRANASLTSFEALRKIDVPYGTEPAFAFPPGLPGRVPIKGPPQFVLARAAAVRAPKELE